MKKTKIEFHFSSILLFTMLGIIILHMGISDFMSAKTLKNEITQNLNNDNKLISDAVSDKLIELFRRPSDELMVITNTINETTDYSKGFDEGVHITKNMRNFDRLILVDESEKVINVWPYNSYIFGIDQSGTGYNKTLRDDRKPFWSSTYINYTSGEISIDLVMPLKTGYIVGTIYLEELSKIVTSLKNKPGTIVAIADTNDTYLAHTDSEKVKQRVKDSYLLDLSLNKSLNKKGEVQIDGQLMIPFVKTLDNYGWSVVIYYPVSLYEKPVMTLISKIIVVQLGSLLLIILFMFFISTYLNKVLSSLFGFIKNIEDGNYNIKSPQIFLKEFKDVITGFEHMASKIKYRETQILDKNIEIKKMNEELEVKIKERTIDLELANQNLNHTMQSLIQTQEKLIQQEKLSSLGSLVEGIAHEVNTPLGISITTSTFMEKEINELTETLGKGDLSINEIKDFLETMQESGAILSSSLKQSSQLIDNFKNISVKQKSFSMVDASVYEILVAVFMELGYSINDPKFKIHISPENIKIHCFPEDIVLILFNLLRNALVHGIKEKSQGEIIITITSEGNGIVMVVKDSGKGISSENLSRIFDPFYTTHRGNIEGGSRGLGLYIVYNLIDKRYHGSIECDSIEDNNTTFTVKIPNCLALE